MYRALASVFELRPRDADELTPGQASMLLSGDDAPPPKPKFKTRNEAEAFVAELKGQA